MSRFFKKLAKIKELWRFKEAKFACFWLVIVFAIFIIAILSNSFWKCWNFGAIISTVIYGGAYYGIDLTAKISENITAKNDRTKMLISIIIKPLALFALFSILLIILQSGRFKIGTNLNLIISQFLILTLPAIFWYADNKFRSELLAIYEKKKTSKKKKDWFKNEIDNYQNFILYVDKPASIALLFIFLFTFSGVYFKEIEIIKIEIFVSGASAFQLIAFNCVFSLLLISSLKNKAS